MYSLATYLSGTVNMNVCTYVTAISMKPKQYAVAVYHNTHTLDRLDKSASAVLQLLSKDQIGLVRKLGKQSGKTVDKQRWLENKGVLTHWKDYQVLANSCAFLELKRNNRIQTGGDHDLFVFDLVSFSTKRDDQILDLQDLIENNIIL